MNNDFEKTAGGKVELGDEELSRITGGDGVELDDSTGSSIVFDRAVGEIGKPFVWGGVGPDGYDASGLVGYCLTGVYDRIGTAQTFLDGLIPTGNPKPGDICANSTYCGIYAGPGIMISASHSGTFVDYNGIPGDMVIGKYSV